jgi:hypothetical protein
VLFFAVPIVIGAAQDCFAFAGGVGSSGSSSVLTGPPSRAYL